MNRDIPDAFSDYVRQLIAYNEKDQNYGVFRVLDYALWKGVR